MLRLGKLGQIGPYLEISKSEPKRELAIPLMSPRFWEWEVGATAPSACPGNGGYGVLPPGYCDML